MYANIRICNSPDLLFFILIYLLLFYDGRYLAKKGKFYNYSALPGDSTPLFFILIFLILFY